MIVTITTNEEYASNEKVEKILKAAKALGIIDDYKIDDSSVIKEDVLSSYNKHWKESNITDVGQMLDSLASDSFIDDVSSPGKYIFFRYNRITDEFEYFTEPFETLPPYSMGFNYINRQGFASIEMARQAIYNKIGKDKVLEWYMRQAI